MEDTDSIIFPSAKYIIPIGFDYLKLPEAILEISEAVALFAGIISVVATPDKDETERFYAHFIQSSAVFLVITVFIIVIYVTGVIRKVPISLSLLEVVYCAIAAIVMMAVTSHVAANTYSKFGLILAVVFGFIAMALYFIEVIFAIRAWKKSIIKATLESIEQGKMPQYSCDISVTTRPQCYM